MVTNSTYSEDKDFETLQEENVKQQEYLYLDCYSCGERNTERITETNN